MKKVKHFMTRSIKETYQIFKENNPGVKIGISKFYTLRPKWNRYQFSEFGKSPGSRKWIFSASGHGKGAYDGVGGLLKHFATNHNLRKGPIECIQDLKTLAGIIPGYTPNVKICLLDDQKLKKFRNKNKKNGDLETFDLEDFKYNSVNITAFRIVDVEDPNVKENLEVMEKFQPIGPAILNRSGIIQAEPALMFDSVYVFAKGLSLMDSAHTIKPMNLSCDLEKPWDDGLTLYNFLHTVKDLRGLTGNIEFNEGKRSNFKLDLLKLKKEEIRKVGQWTPDGGINITDPNAFYENHAPNITLVVMTRKERPYVMVKNDKNLTGNARYEGFCIDLLKWIAGQVGFQYTIRLVPDNMYGVYDPDKKEWNGIVRELMEKRADLAVASMTINYARESVIDFTKPFMNLGIGILFKVPTSQPTRLFSFMNPLAVEIWLYVLAAYMLVSFTLFVMARFSPYEWNNPHPCHQESDIVENQFSVSNSFWFITGTFLRQGSGLNPKV
ncbi:unnamed protein product [Brassicogethes aeneus]|uniref:Uncharacterized protein n=1 Tax=Brassicogethes aeneus TaxID=1431903 RepID=A0A9P0ASM5_BRAAE|nr:unnamed protein product [Brassicogethes aeneus]